MLRLSRTFVILLPVLAILFTATLVLGTEEGGYVPDELVCQVRLGYSIDSINNAYGTSTKQYLTQIDAYLLGTATGADIVALAAEISLLDSVLYCEPNYILDAPEPVQSSEPFVDDIGGDQLQAQYALATLSVPAAHDLSTGTGVKVAVIDVGVNLSHPAFNGAVVSGYDYVDGDSVATDPPGGAGSGHGTFVAGVLNLIAPASEIISYRVLDTSGSGNGYTIAEAVLQAVEDGCKVINLSMVMLGKHGALDDAIDSAHSAGVLVVAAAGNDSTETERFPAKDSYTLSVAALDSLNQKADFSSYNGKVDVSAPGKGIYAPYLDTTYGRWEGTSFAAPWVAGLAALLWSYDTTAGLAEINNAIVNTAIDISQENPEYEDMLGTGLIDPVAALNAVASFICGDVSGDFQGPNVADLTFLVEYLFLAGPSPPMPELADIDGSDSIDVADLSFLVDYLFRGGTEPICF